MNIEILDASYHRNGIAGVGFWAVLFKDLEENGRVMIASLFDAEYGFCAIYAVDELQKHNIAFAAGNSWRGDQFEEALRPLLDEWKDSHESNQVGPFAMPDMRPDRN